MMTALNASLTSSAVQVPSKRSVVHRLFVWRLHAPVRRPIASKAAPAIATSANP